MGYALAALSKLVGSRMEGNSNRQAGIFLYDHVNETWLWERFIKIYKAILLTQMRGALWISTQQTPSRRCVAVAGWNQIKSESNAKAFRWGVLSYSPIHIDRSMAWYILKFVLSLNICGKITLGGLDSENGPQLLTPANEGRVRRNQTTLEPDGTLVLSESQNVRLLPPVNLWNQPVNPWYAKATNFLNNQRKEWGWNWFSRSDLREHWQCQWNVNWNAVQSLTRTLQRSLNIHNMYRPRSKKKKAYFFGWFIIALCFKLRVILVTLVTEA